MTRTLLLAHVALVLAGCPKGAAVVDAGAVPDVSPEVAAAAPLAPPATPPPPLVVSPEGLAVLNVPLSLSRVQAAFPKRTVVEREESSGGHLIGLAYELSSGGYVDFIVHAADGKLFSVEVLTKNAADARGIHVGDRMDRPLVREHTCVRGQEERAGSVMCWELDEPRMIYVAHPADDKAWAGTNNDDVPDDVLKRLPIKAIVYSPGSK